MYIVPIHHNDVINTINIQTLYYIDNSKSQTYIIFKKAHYFPAILQWNYLH